MEKLTGIKAISFDADGTLWDFVKVMRHSLKFVLEAINELDPQAGLKLDIDLMIKIRNKIANELKGIVTNLEDIRLHAFRETLKAVKRPNEELANHLNQIYLKHRFEDIELYDDVLPTLRALKKEYTLGILSNGNSYPERCGLEEMFDFVVFSQDFGIEKPDKEIFNIMLEKAKCKKNEIVHIGDSLETDIQGAINAEMKCIWLNRNEMPNPDNFKLEYKITSLTELIDILL